MSEQRFNLVFALAKYCILMYVCVYMHTSEFMYLCVFYVCRAGDGRSGAHATVPSQAGCVLCQLKWSIFMGGTTFY